MVNRTRKTNPDNGMGTEAFEAWQDLYRQMADEGLSFYQKGIDTVQRMFPPMYPGGELFGQWMENYQDMMSRMGEDVSRSPGDMDVFRRMYDTWLDAWTRGLESYMRTPEFAAKSGKDIERFSDIQKRTGEMMEAYWHAMRLPSTHDMREIYHKLYILERKLDDLDRQIRARQPKPRSTSATAQKRK